MRAPYFRRDREWDQTSVCDLIVHGNIEKPEKERKMPIKNKQGWLNAIDKCIAQVHYGTSRRSCSICQQAVNGLESCDDCVVTYYVEAIWHHIGNNSLFSPCKFMCKEAGHYLENYDEVRERLKEIREWVEKQEEEKDGS